MCSTSAAKSETGHLLEQVLDLDALRAAWERVARNRGTAGADGVTMRRFGFLLDSNLLHLADAVRDGSYRPGKPRKVVIRTGSGARRKTRVITILPVRDRVLQRAALDVLEPLFEARFLPCSFAYRPGRSVTGAVNRVITLRDRGRAWVVDADIQDCFASVDHALLDSMLASAIPDPSLLALLRQWIAAGGRGIPLGGVICPLLCNIYLHELDLALTRRHYPLVRYADDFVILCRSRSEAERVLRSTARILSHLKLELNAHKTKLVSFDEGFTYLGVRFEGDICRCDVNGKHLTARNRFPIWLPIIPDSYDGTSWQLASCSSVVSARSARVITTVLSGGI